MHINIDIFTWTDLLKFFLVTGLMSEIAEIIYKSNLTKNTRKNMIFAWNIIKMIKV